MKRNLLLQISDGLAGLFEGGIREQEIQNYCLKEFDQINAAHDKPQSVIRDMELAVTLLHNLEWFEVEKKGDTGGFSKDNPSAAEIREWKEFLKTRHVLQKGMMMPGGSYYLDLLDGENDKEIKLIVRSNLERILKHVEVMRRKSLSSYSTGLSHNQLWLERYDTGILFSRYARRHNDLRFLNTALKLNDWFLTKKPGGLPLECRSRLLLSLCEQEFSAKEMLG
ncbi:MAG TPA: hypothetical protein DCY35_11830 [Prolixibacteraceae bacterium]|nr:hypothetical protein [Prolixibacteraceae bacterium]